MATVQANETRSHGPAHDTWPASLPYVSYVTADGAFLCVTCANEHPLSAGYDDDQWRVIGAQVNSEPVACEHCYRTIAPIASAVNTVR